MSRIQPRAGRDPCANGSRARRRWHRRRDRAARGRDRGEDQAHRPGRSSSPAKMNRTSKRPKQRRPRSSPSRLQPPAPVVEAPAAPVAHPAPPPAAAPAPAPLPSAPKVIAPPKITPTPVSPKHSAPPAPAPAIAAEAPSDDSTAARVSCGAVAAAAGSSRLHRAADYYTGQSLRHRQHIERKPITPAPQLLQPKAAVIQGPHVVREEKPDIVPRPRPRRPAG